MNSLTSIFSIHFKIECPCTYGGTRDEVRRREKEGKEEGRKKEENTETGKEDDERLASLNINSYL